MGKYTEVYERYRQIKALKKKRRKVFAYKIIFLISVIFWVLIITLI
jgi:dipeptide/tripeptide permease